jgi:hypothetical protein
MIHKLSILLAISFLSFPFNPGRTQHQLLMEKKVDNLMESTNGPNLKRYMESRLYYGMGVNAGNNLYPVKPLGNSELEFGLRYKVKINSILSTGLGAGYFYQSYRVDQEQKHFPDSTRYNREAFRINSLKSNFFIRINFDPKRGNYIGKYLETGLYGSWSFDQKRIMLSRYDDTSESQISKSKEIQSGLSYIEKLQYGVFISLGISRYEISYRRRLSDLISRDSYQLDFTPNTLGVSIGFSL